MKASDSTREVAANGAAYNNLGGPRWGHKSTFESLIVVS